MFSNKERNNFCFPPHRACFVCGDETKIVSIWSHLGEVTKLVWERLDYRVECQEKDNWAYWITLKYSTFEGKGGFSAGLSLNFSLGIFVAVANQAYCLANTPS